MPSQAPSQDQPGAGMPAGGSDQPVQPTWQPPIQQPPVNQPPVGEGNMPQPEPMPSGEQPAGQVQEPGQTDPNQGGGPASPGQGGQMTG